MGLLESAGVVDCIYKTHPTLSHIGASSALPSLPQSITQSTNYQQT